MIRLTAGIGLNQGFLAPSRPGILNHARFSPFAFTTAEMGS